MFTARLVWLGLLSALLAAAQVPRIFHTDLESGPNTGGERNQGAFVTLYGKRFGDQRGSATVTFGGGAVASYVSWSDAKVVVQLGPAAATGEVFLRNNGGLSNSVPFTVRAGNILAVSTTGSDTGPNDGSLSAPWRTIQKAVERMAPGDIVYVLDGVVETRGNSKEGSVYISGTGGAGNNGAPGLPKALIAYPGAKVRIGAAAASPCDSLTCVEGIRTGWPSSHWTIAGFQLFGNNYGIVIRGKNWRVIGNEFTCPSGSGASACMDGSTAEQIKVWGNTMRDTGYNLSSALYHGIYFSTDSNDLDIGWNTVSKVQGCRGIQIHSTMLDATSGFNQGNIRIHDNLIEDTQCDGIVLATMDPGKGPIELYNNVIVNAGRGPATPSGGGNFACIYAPGTTNNGAPGGGTMEVFHNTMVDCGGFTGASSGGVMLVQRNPALRLRVRNNIIYNRRAQYFGIFDASGRACNTTCQNLFGSTNLFFGLGAPVVNPVLTGGINQDPAFASFDGRDYRLRANSPARGVGINTGLVTDRDGIIRTSVADLGAYQSSGSSLTAPSPLTVTPEKVEAASTAGGGAALIRQLTLTNTGTGRVEWTASSDQPWLTLAARQGTVLGGSSQAVALTISVDSLPPANYQANVTIFAAEARIIVPIQLSVTPLSTSGPAIWTSAPVVNFAADREADLTDQTVRIANAGAAGSTLRWSARTDQPWLRVSPSEGTLAPGPTATLTLSATAPRPLGIFTGNLIITADGAFGSPLSVPVRLAIGSPKISAIVNAASLGSGTMSPRTIFTIFGENIGPEAGVGFQLTPDNRAITASAGGVQVLFGETPAPILYASISQINGIVPAGPSRQAEVRVEYLTRRSAPVTVPLAITSPAIFSVNGSGSGPGAILNQDGALNTDDAPAARGSIVAIYLTGLGNVFPPRDSDPAVADGEVISGAGYRLGNATQVTVGGQDAAIAYAGVAPGFVAGVFQVNIAIPAGLTAGRQVIRITSGGVPTPDIVTVAVR